MAPKFEGITITLGGEPYVVPPLNFKALRTLGPRLQRLADLRGALSGDDLSAVSEIIHLALVRNYPDLTVEQLEDLLDVRTMGPAVEAVMEASGFTRGKAAGAAGTSSPGETSTPPSPLLSDGPGSTSTSA